MLGAADLSGNQQHGKTDALEQRLQLAGPCGGDHLAAGTFHDEETHHGDADFADQEQNGGPPGEFGEYGGDDKRATGHELVGDGIHQFTELGHLIVFAGHPTVELIGARGDDEDDRRRPAHGSAVRTPCTGRNVQSEEHHDQHDAAVGHQIRRSVPAVQQRVFS